MRWREVDVPSQERPQSGKKKEVNLALGQPHLKNARNEEILALLSFDYNDVGYTGRLGNGPEAAAGFGRSAIIAAPKGQGSQANFLSLVWIPAESDPEG